MTGITFHDRMHELIFRSTGASRLGAVQTTIVWQFVVFHYPNLDATICIELINLQERVNDAARNSEAMEKAIARLLNRVSELDTGDR